MDFLSSVQALIADVHHRFFNVCQASALNTLRSKLLWRNKRYMRCISTSKCSQRLLKHQSALKQCSFLKLRIRAVWFIVQVTGGLFSNKFRPLTGNAVCLKMMCIKFAPFNYKSPWIYTTDNISLTCSEEYRWEGALLMHTFIFHLLSPFTVQLAPGLAYTALKLFCVVFHSLSAN